MRETCTAVHLRQGSITGSMATGWGADRPQEREKEDGKRALSRTSCLHGNWAGRTSTTRWCYTAGLAIVSLTHYLSFSPAHPLTHLPPCPSGWDGGVSVKFIFIVYWLAPHFTASDCAAWLAGLGAYTCTGQCGKQLNRTDGGTDGHSHMHTQSPPVATPTSQAPILQELVPA